MESPALQMWGSTDRESWTIVETAQVDGDRARIDADDARHGLADHR